MKTSTREIRNRLLYLLSRAFVFALLLSLAFFFAALSYAVLSPRTGRQEWKCPTDLLVGYYVGHGSWDGVENIIALDNVLSTTPLLLLDENNRIILDQRPEVLQPSLAPSISLSLMTSSWI